MGSKKKSSESAQSQKQGRGGISKETPKVESDYNHDDLSTLLNPDHTLQTHDHHALMDSLKQHQIHLQQQHIARMHMQRGMEL